MKDPDVLFALALTAFAGLSTGIGSLMSLLSKKFNPKFLAGALGFSAGVMVYVSLVEIFPEARTSLSLAYGDKLGYIYTTVAFFAGIAIIAVIDRLIPSGENPHEIKNIDIHNIKPEQNAKLLRMGLFSALAIAIHNFPEGLATFMAALENPTLGISIAVAIAIHNIPEGIAVSVPIYQATGKKRKAFWWSLLSGLSEPLGAVIGYFILLPFWSPTIEGALMALTAGIMVYISLDELLPTAERYGKHHYAIIGVVAGMIFMAVSILLLH